MHATTEDTERGGPAAEAALVRRKVTRGVLDMASCEPSELGLREALAIARHLTVDNIDGAIAAHRAIIKMLRKDLWELGVVEEEYVAVASQLAAFLLTSGYRLDKGRWAEDPRWAAFDRALAAGELQRGAS